MLSDCVCLQPDVFSSCISSLQKKKKKSLLQILPNSFILSAIHSSPEPVLLYTFHYLLWGSQKRKLSSGFCFLFFFLFWPLPPWHMEVPDPGIGSQQQWGPKLQRRQRGTLKSLTHWPRPGGGGGGAPPLTSPTTTPPPFSPQGTPPLSCGKIKLFFFLRCFFFFFFFFSILGRPEA